MKKIGTTFTLLIALSGALLFSSCKDDADPDAATQLKSNAGADQSVAPFSTVTLDGSASTGEGDIHYEWKYDGQQQVGLSNATDKIVTFSPQQNGVYTFTLRITQGTNFSEDQVVITVSGVIALSGTLSEDFILTDVEPDPTKPDYTITTDLTIPSGKSMVLPDRGSGNMATIIIEMGEGAGIIIDGGSFMFNANNELYFNSDSGWKGFLLKTGTLQLSSGVRVQKAGNGLFADQTEGAAITALDGRLILSGTIFSESAGHDVFIHQLSSGSSDIVNNIFSAPVPIKAPIELFSKISDNVYNPYDYLMFTTPGASTSVTAPNGFIFRQNVKYYIDGDFTAGSTINLNSGASIYMKEGAGIFLSGSSAGMTITGSAASIEGLDDSSWKGIAVGTGASFSLSGLTLKNAGSDVFNTGSFTSAQKAAVYYAGSTNGAIANSKIIDSDGYGIYIDTQPGIVFTVAGTEFTNPTSAAIKASVDVINQSVVKTNTYTMSPGVAAVEVASTNPSNYQPAGTWQALGGDNYYLITGNIFAGSSWTLAPGVNLKFMSGKSLDVQGGLFTAIGTQSNPITFDGAAGTSGSWPGMAIETTYNIEFCEIKNGGGSLIFKGGTTLATEQANIVFNNPTNASNTFKNNTISGSAGFGILVESGKQSPDALNMVNNNIFSSNADPNIVIK